MGAVKAVLGDVVIELQLADVKVSREAAHDLATQVSFSKMMEVSASYRGRFRSARLWFAMVHLTTPRVAQALCAIALMREPDPYKPIAGVLRSFFARLLPVLGGTDDGHK